MAVTAGAGPLQLQFEAPRAVHEALAALGRTEDIRFSPSRSRLALACYAAQRIAVAEVELGWSGEQPEIAVTSLHALGSRALREPHGVDFLDEETLVVANRGGGITALRLVQRSGRLALEPVGDGDARQRTSDGPGSVTVLRRGERDSEVLVCRNWTNAVTRHVLDVDGLLSPGRVVAQRGLALPDGLSVSHDGRWLAVSSHNSHCVLVYELASAGADADPVALLRGARYPHGVRFSGNDRHLLVADAGAPEVHVYAAVGDDWRGVAYPAATVPVMDAETFARGRLNPQEGGPKGIDLDTATNVLVATSEYAPLGFFHVEDALRGRGWDPDPSRLLDYELEVFAEHESTRAAVAGARAAVLELQQTMSWRITRPLRAVYARVAALRRGRG